MLIGIDGNEANVEKRVGVNEYAFQVLQNLQKLQKRGKNPHRLIVYLKEKPLWDLPKETEGFKYKIIPSRKLWILTKLMPSLFFEKNKPDIFFSPSHYLPPFSPQNKICAIMDLGYLEFPAQFTKKVFWQLKWWSAISIFISKRIICISESTKRDIVRHYPFAKNKISVVYLGFDSDKFNLNISEKDVRRVKNKYSIVDDYVLYLGTLKPSKNVEGLVKAFAQVSKKFPKVKLVIAGKRGWLYESIYEIVKKSGLTSKVVFTGYLPDEDRPALISGAKVYLQPSFWEGFGIEVVSAMASGTPVVVSNVSSLPEVIGESGILVNPKNVDDISSAIKKVLSMNKVEYNKVVQEGLKQSKKFSWEKCATEILQIIEKTTNKK